MLAILAMTSDFYDRKSEATSHFYDRKSEATSHLSLESCQTQLQSPDSPGSANSEDQQSHLDLSGGSTSQHQDSLWPVQDRAGDQGAPPLLQMPALWTQPEGVQGSSPVRDLCRTSQQRCLPEEAKQIIQHSSPQVHQLWLCPRHAGETSSPPSAASNSIQRGQARTACSDSPPATEDSSHPGGSNCSQSPACGSNSEPDAYPERLASRRKKSTNIFRSCRPNKPWRQPSRQPRDENAEELLRVLATPDCSRTRTNTD
jgi:hypothetical protein